MSIDPSPRDSTLAQGPPATSSDFGVCVGWQAEWAAAIADADPAPVVLGAWDVLDLELDRYRYPFSTPQADDVFSGNLGSRIDAVLAAATDLGRRRDRLRVYRPGAALVFS
ncbi:hypothetical protein BH23ACT3_BH23ACT3_07380 [soil metagenome]